MFFFLYIWHILYMLSSIQLGDIFQFTFPHSRGVCPSQRSGTHRPGDQRTQPLVCAGASLCLVVEDTLQCPQPETDTAHHRSAGSMATSCRDNYVLTKCFPQKRFDTMAILRNYDSELQWHTLTCHLRFSVWMSSNHCVRPKHNNWSCFLWSCDDHA